MQRPLLLAGLLLFTTTPLTGHAQTPRSFSVGGTVALTGHVSAVIAPTGRAPAQTDNDLLGYAAPANWLTPTTSTDPGRLYQLQDMVGHVAAWQPVTAAVLPLDAIGMRVSSLAVATPGTNYAAGDTVILAGSGKATASYNGTSWTITNPAWFGCAPTTTVGQVAPPASGGTGVSFTLGFLRPIGYGTRRLSRCYPGSLVSVSRRDTGETQAIGALANGALDEASIDTFAQNTVTNVTLLDDQGGGGLNATPQAGVAVFYPARRLGNARSVVFDQATFVVPPGYGMDVRNNTVAAVTGVRSVDYNPGVMDFGFGPAKVWLSQGDSRNTLAFTTGILGSANIGIADSQDSLRDDPNVLVGTTLNGASTLLTNGLSSSSSTTDTGTTTSGGFIISGGYGDGVAFIAAPFGLTAAQQQALAASLSTTFGVQGQGQNMLVVVGHSLNDGTGTTYQQGWPRQMAQQLNRPDIHVVNVSHAGATCVQQLAEFTNRGVPALAHVSGAKVVSILCGDNDFAANTSLTTTQMGGLYDAIANAAHAAGATTLCIEPPYANRSYISTGGGPALTAAQANAQMVAPFGVAIASRLGGTCDAVVDEKLVPAFNLPNGPFSTTYYADGVHPTNLAAGILGSLIGNTLLTMMP
ncbi:SGNH/GDSL hydrolase family protein [Lichenicola sp.]|uniref:SGNH/GDSL hydrolase family protein n=1 Tax=Lichenicola sp. TaxID=2804529 RepID=UPI003AFFEBDE